MLSRLALRFLKRFTPTSRLLAESETARASEVVLRRPSTTAHTGVKAGAVDVGVSPPYPANLRTPSVFLFPALTPLSMGHGPWSMAEGVLQPSAPPTEGGAGEPPERREVPMAPRTTLNDPEVIRQAVS